MLCFGKCSRAFELHVLDEMRQSLLVVVFQHRTGLDDEPQFGAAAGFAVGAHVIAQAVGQRADDDLRIDRHLLRQAVRGDRRGGRLPAGGYRLRGGDSGRGEHGGKHTEYGGAETRHRHTPIVTDSRARTRASLCVLATGVAFIR